MLKKTMISFKNTKGFKKKNSQETCWKTFFLLYQCNFLQKHLIFKDFEMLA